MRTHDRVWPEGIKTPGNRYSGSDLKLHGTIV
uniref:Uncharacterized protein n=1 Tax=Anguilla anguilla TaxID=7936 RepID=A0A0E9T290_ANGAN